MKNYIQRGDTLTLTAPAALTSGDTFKVGSIIAIATADAVSGASIEGNLTGVYELAKVTGTAFTAGDKLYWDDTAKNFTKTATSNTLAGVAVLDAASAATTAKIRLNGSVS